MTTYSASGFTLTSPNRKNVVVKSVLHTNGSVAAGEFSGSCDADYGGSDEMTALPLNNIDLYCACVGRSFLLSAAD